MQTHRFDILSFTSGLLFLATGAVVFAGQEVLTFQAEWAVPVLALVIGVAFLASAARRAERSSTTATPVDLQPEEELAGIDPDPIED